MMQQINLYVNELKYVEPSYSFSFITRWMIYTCILSLILTAILYGVNVFIGNMKDAKNMEYHQVTQSLIRVKKEYPKPEVDKKLIDKIKALEEEKVRNKEIVNYLKLRNSDIKNQAFSVYMKAFTQVKQKGVWLTNVSITDAGKSIGFKGNTLKPENLSEFLLKLKNLNIFNNMNFKIFNMYRDDGLLKFEISTLTKQAELDEMAIK